MSNDVKLELCPFCGGPAQIIAGAPGCYYVRCEGCSVTSDDGSRERVITKWNTRHQPQEREAVLEQALLQCASRFSAYAELHAEKLWDGSLSEAQRQTVRDKVDRNLRYAAEARAALTTPAPAEGDDLSDEQWNRVLENAPKPDGPLTPITPAVSTDEIVAVLERCRDREHNPFEPDNQTTLHGELCAILSRLRDTGDKA